MLQYLIILLDDTSTSYCHYSNYRTERRLIAQNDLAAGILFAMKENLMIQFVYPSYELPPEYKAMVETVDHNKILPAGASGSSEADVVVFNDWDSLAEYDFRKNTVYVLRTSKSDFFHFHALILNVLEKATRLNVVLTDLDTFDDADLDKYSNVLETLLKGTGKLYVRNATPQLNLLTDRIMLDKMNNCNAGYENLTLAPDGKLYICPAFYQHGWYAVGDPERGVDIKNPQLYRLDHAPLCRNCDAYQCKRCVWLNRKTTLEVNTPSHEQCVAAHLERNASRVLLRDIQRRGTFLLEKTIEEIDYLDPFDVRKKI